jgi:hypothetical protein
VWEAVIEERALHFSLIGINNQNFLMKDRETGSWWQQVSGEAIQGPLKGRRLKLIHHDEMTFNTWRSENPAGRVLRPEPAIIAANRYAPADWEKRIAKLPLVLNPGGGSGLSARTLVVGIRANNTSKAYPFELLKNQNPIQDSVGGLQILIALHSDGKSLRAFNRKLDGQVLEFFRVVDSPEFQLTDSQTGSRWNFAGQAVSGPLAGKQLSKVYALLDFWFDWNNYNPESKIYKLQ